MKLANPTATADVCRNQALGSIAKKACHKKDIPSKSLKFSFQKEKSCTRTIYVIKCICLIFLSKKLGSEVPMAVSYKKLFKLLIDREMKKKDLQEAAGLSSSSVTKLAKDEHTDAISTISIMPFCVDEEFKNTFACKERKYIGWKRKEADIRLFIPFIPFVQASKEEKLSICKEIIKKSLTEIHARCMVKKVQFDLETLLCDIFPSK